MKICAIRLREVGKFSEPVALEGLSGGLDILVGPNELGKSTILRAVRAVFYEQHKSSSVKNTKALLHNLCPQSGGAPLIEVDFAIDGRRLRLRKQFLSGKQASLYDLDAGHVLARADEADAQVLELLARHPGGTKRDGKLMWVGQRDALQHTTPSREEQAGLRNLIEAQLGDVADGGGARIVRQKIRTRLAQMLTASSKQPKANSDYANAVKEQTSLRAKLSAAQARANEARDQLAHLDELVAEREALENPKTVGALAERHEGAVKALEAARQAREKLHAAQAIVEKCSIEQEKETLGLSVYEAQLKEFGDLSAAEKGAKKELKSLREQAKAAAGAVQRARQQRDELRLKVAAARRAGQQLEQLARAGEMDKKLAAAQEDFAKAQAADKQLQDVTASLNNLKVTRQLVDQARSLAQALVSADAQLNAAAPQISISYVAGGAGKITEAGRALKDGTVLQRRSPIVLDIEGVGQIRIEPGASQDLAALEEDATAQRAQLDECLAVMGAADLNQAEKALASKAQMEEQANLANAALQILAPDGVPTLARHVQDLQDMTAGNSMRDEDTAPDVPALKAAAVAIETLANDLQNAGDKFEKLTEQSTQLVNKLAGLEARAAGQAKQLEILRALLPPSEEERQTRREKLREIAAQSERASNSARRDLADWQNKAGNDAAYQGLRDKLQDAQRDSERASRQLSEVKLDLAKTQSALQTLAQDGAPARVIELQEMLARLDKQVARYGQEVAALQLLDELLLAQEQATQDKFLAPVLAAVRPYLTTILPGADLRFSDDLDVLGLARQSHEQTLDLLSAGTQEQIAVLVRLGFARLSAQNGAPMPVILDDALVYSDDERIARAFDALQAASKLHQVIILTCRSASFAALGGNKLALQEWKMDDTAA